MLATTSIRRRKDAVDKAAEAYERLRQRGLPVRRVVIEGKRVEVDFATEATDDFDLVDMRR